MTYPKHFLCVFGGVLGATVATAVDEWQCTLRLARTSSDPALPDPDPATVMVNEFKTAVETWMLDNNSGWSNWAWLQYLKVNEIGPDGKYASATSSNRYDYPAGSPVRNTFNGPISQDPAQALVISWRTQFQRGPGHAGRLYIPMPANINTMANARLATSAITSMANSAKTFIQNATVGGAATAQWGPCVVSNRGLNGAANEIQRVRVGDVIDHQLRRRDRMVENYVEVTI